MKRTRGRFPQPRTYGTACSPDHQSQSGRRNVNEGIMGLENRPNQPRKDYSVFALLIFSRDAHLHKNA